MAKNLEEPIAGGGVDGGERLEGGGVGDGSRARIKPPRTAGGTHDRKIHHWFGFEGKKFYERNDFFFFLYFL